MKNRTNRYMQWAPRILGLLFVFFLMLFSLDVVKPELTTTEMVGGFVMHNAPAFILLLGLVASWKYEIVGGIVFATAGLLYILLLVTDKGFGVHMISWIATIAAPAFFISALFTANWFSKRKRQRA